MQEPTVRVTVKEQDIVSVTLSLKLTNKDNVKLENYKYVVLISLGFTCISIDPNVDNGFVANINFPISLLVCSPLLSFKL